MWLLNAGQVNHSKGGDIQNHEKNNADRERRSNFEVGKETWEHEWLDDLVLGLDSLDMGQAERHEWPGGQVRGEEQVWLWAEGVVASRSNDNWRGVSGQDRGGQTEQPVQGVGGD